jgi:hypothetical protein
VQITISFTFSISFQTKTLAGNILNKEDGVMRLYVRIVEIPTRYTVTKTAGHLSVPTAKDNST